MNTLVVAAVERLLAKIDHAQELEDDISEHPDDMVRQIGWEWSHAIVATGAAGPKLRHAWEQAMIEQQIEDQIDRASTDDSPDNDD